MLSWCHETDAMGSKTDQADMIDTLRAQNCINEGWLNNKRYRDISGIWSSWIGILCIITMHYNKRYCDISRYDRYGLGFSDKRYCDISEYNRYGLRSSALKLLMQMIYSTIVLDLHHLIKNQRFRSIITIFFLAKYVFYCCYIFRLRFTADTVHIIAKTL